MKKILNKKICLLVAILVFALAFAYKNYGKNLYMAEISLGASTVKADEASKVAYWKLDENEMGPWDYMRLSKDSSEMTIDEISEKLGKKPKLSKPSKTSTSKEKDEKEIVEIKNLSQGIYLFKKIGKDIRKTPAIVEYVGEQAAKNGVLHIDLK